MLHVSYIKTRLEKTSELIKHCLCFTPYLINSLYYQTFVECLLCNSNRVGLSDLAPFHKHVLGLF